MRGTQKIGLGLLLILIAWISAAQATDLVGNWTGSLQRDMLAQMVLITAL